MVKRNYYLHHLVIDHWHTIVIISCLAFFASSASESSRELAMNDESLITMALGTSAYHLEGPV